MVTEPNIDIPELMVVMPVFNEEASVRKVAYEWFSEIQNWTEHFVFYVIDDGSTDGTPDCLTRIAGQLGSRFEVHRQSNSGHGQTCLAGYREACERGIPLVLQIDSDGQCDPQYFFRFWRLRDQFNVTYGNRVSRDDGIRRILASHVLRFTILICCGVWCADANVPFRLMQTKGLREVVDLIPRDFVLANVALAVLLRRKATWKHGIVPIGFRERYGGEPSVKLSKFGVKAIELVRQLRSIL